MTDAEASKTLTAIALVLMAGYFLFGAPLLLQLVLALLLLAVFPNPLSRVLAGSWLRFGELLGRVNARIFLVIVYFLVLVPVSLCYRRFNRGQVAYFRGDDRDSYFSDARTPFTPEQFEKSW